MTQPTLTPTSDGPAYKPMPAWLAIGIIAACVAASVGLLWWWFSDTRRPILVDLPSTPSQAQVRRAQVIDDNWTDDVRSLGGGNWAVRAGDNRLNISTRTDEKTNETRKRFNLTYRQPLVDGDDRALLRVPSLANREEAAKELGLTDDQRAAIRKLPRMGATAMRASKEDVAKVEQAWAAFDAAADDAKDPAEQAVLAALREVGDRSVDPSRQQLAEQVTKVREILTPEQIEAARKAAQ